MIYLECRSDKALIKALGIPVREIIHANGKGNVCNQLAKRSNVKGLVDEDPANSQPSYIGKLKLHFHQYDIKVFDDEKMQNRLIMLCPELENWILRAVTEAEVNLSLYNLPNEAKKLHSIININLKKFESLLETLKDKSKMLKTLESFLKSK